MLYHGPELSQLNDHMSTERANVICYHEPNSLRGIVRIKGLGLNASDWDINRTKDGKIIVTHWGQPLLKWVGFVDHSGAFKVNNPIHTTSLTYAQIKNFQSRIGGYHIWDLETFMDKAAEEGMTPFFEWKGGPGTDKLFSDAYAVVRNSGGTAKFMTLPTDAHLHAMYLAGKHGFEAGVLARGTVPRIWFTEAKIAFWKGSAAQGKYAGTSGAVQVGLGAAGATQYGTGNIATAATAKAAKVRIEKLGGHVGYYTRSKAA
jgi:hypothetical protein